MNVNKSFAIISLFLLTGCLSTIKPAKQIDDNQKVIAKEEKKVEEIFVIDDISVPNKTTIEKLKELFSSDAAKII